MSRSLQAIANGKVEVLYIYKTYIPPNQNDPVIGRSISTPMSLQKK